MRLLRSIVYCLFALSITSTSWAFEIPKLQGHVNDYTAVLTQQAAAAIELGSAAIEKRDGTQVVVLTVKDMGDAADIKEFANKVFVTWGLGQKGVDNGVLVVLALKERMIRIEVGKGLEEHLTDAGSAQIIRAARPSLSKGDYSGGLLQITQEVQKAVSGKFIAPAAVKQQPVQPHKSAPSTETFDPILGILIAGLIFFGVLAFVLATFNAPPPISDKNQQSFDDKLSRQSRTVKTWGPDEFKRTDSNRSSAKSKGGKAAAGIAAAVAVSAVAATSRRRREDDDSHSNRESSWPTSYDTGSSSSSSSDSYSGGGGDSGGGGSDSSF